MRARKSSCESTTSCRALQEAARRAKMPCSTSWAISCSIASLWPAARGHHSRRLASRGMVGLCGPRRGSLSMSYHRPLGAVPLSRASAQAPRLVRPAQVAPIRSTASAGHAAPRAAFAPLAQRSTDTMGPRPTAAAQFARASASDQVRMMAPSSTVRHTEYAGNYRPLRTLPPVSLPFRTPLRSAVTSVDLPFQPPAATPGRRRRRRRRRRGR